MKADFPEQALRLNVALHRTDTNDLQTLIPEHWVSPRTRHGRNLWRRTRFVLASY
ncbi:MAG: hypothetical protein IPG64_14970 [Haliea sp.]|nr:hypothetical protein [Haliea sp.]